MINDKYCDIHHNFHSIINTKNIIIHTMKKKLLLNNTSWLLINNKTYTISKKK
jgi:hypothetical protein